MEISRRRDASIAFFSVMKGDLVESYHGELSSNLSEAASVVSAQ